MIQETANPRRIAVIGGGIAGLAAAHRIAELAPAAEVTLFEASDRLGGVIGTIRQDGFLIERSADSFITSEPAAVDLCRRIGFAEQLIPTDPGRRGAMVVARGKLRRVPDGFLLMSPQRIWPVLASPILSLRGKLRLACEQFVRARRDGSSESIADFARRRLGVEAFERLVQPLVGGIYTGDPEKLELAATLPRFLDMEREYGSLTRAARVQGSVSKGQEAGGRRHRPSDSGARYSMFVTPRDGLSNFVDAIAARLPAGCVRFNSPVARIEYVSGQWSVVSGQQSDAETFDAVIVAAPAPVAAKMLRPADGEVSRELSEIEHAGSAIVVLGYDRSQIHDRLDSFGFVVPAIERRQILSASFSSVKFSGRAPHGKVLIRVFLGGALQSELLDRSDDELRAVADGELRELLGISGPPCLSIVFRWPKAMPQFHLGHVERVQRINERIARLPGLALAGNAYEGVGVPQCIRSGEAAVELVLGMKKPESRNSSVIPISNSQ